MKTFFVCQPWTRRPIINMFTKVSMGAKFREFMRIEKRSSVCVIYQPDQDKQILSPLFAKSVFLPLTNYPGFIMEYEERSVVRSS